MPSGLGGGVGCWMNYSGPHWPQQIEEPATREEGEVWSPQKVTEVCG